MRPLERELAAPGDLADLPAEERWGLGEYRPPQRWWIPTTDDARRMARFARDGGEAVREIARYD